MRWWWRTGFGASRPATPTTDRAAILAESQETDEDILLAFRDGRCSFVLLVYGNGVDVISDYSSALEQVLEPVHTYVEAMS